MQTVSVSRSIEASPAAVEAAIDDVESFVRAAGFDEVDVDGSTIEVANRVGIAEISLTLQQVPDPDLPADAEAAVTHEQREGIFEEMTTTYVLRETDAGTTVTATTRFALAVPVVGDVLDATIIKRQRRRELEAQLDYLQQQVDRAEPTPD